MWLISLWGNLQPSKFDDMFRAEKALSRVLAKYLDVRNQVANLQGLEVSKQKHFTCDILKDETRQRKDN